MAVLIAYLIDEHEQYSSHDHNQPKTNEHIDSNDIEIEIIDPVVNAAVYATNDPVQRCNILKDYYRRDGDKLFHGSQFITQILRDEALPNE